jgi:hypothetical protein
VLSGVHVGSAGNGYSAGDGSGFEHFCSY